MKNIRSFLGGLRSLANTQTSAEFDKLLSYLNKGSIYHPKTGLINRYKGLFNESKLGNIKNITEIAKVAFKKSRLQQEKIGYKLQDNSKHGFKRAQSGLDNIRSNGESKGSNSQENVDHGKKTMETTQTQSQLILRSQSRNSLVKLQDCTTVSIISKRGDFSGFRFYIDSNIMKLQVNVKVNSDKNRSQLDTNKSTLQKIFKAGIDCTRPAAHKFQWHLNGSNSIPREDKNDAERIKFYRIYSQIVSQLGRWQKEVNGQRGAQHCKYKLKRKWSIFGKIHNRPGSVPRRAGRSRYQEGNEENQSKRDRSRWTGKQLWQFLKFIFQLLFLLLKISGISFSFDFKQGSPPNVDDVAFLFVFLFL